MTNDHSCIQGQLAVFPLDCDLDVYCSEYSVAVFPSFAGKRCRDYTSGKHYFHLDDNSSLFASGFQLHIASHSFYRFFLSIYIQLLFVLIAKIVVALKLSCTVFCVTSPGKLFYHICYFKVKNSHLLPSGCSLVRRWAPKFFFLCRVA